MSSIKKSQAERVGRWRSLLSKEPELLAQMPHLAPDLATLREMEEEAVALFAEIAGLRSTLRGAVARLRDLTRRGDLLRTRLGAGLRSRLGFENPLLIRYGYQPRPARSGPRDEVKRHMPRPVEPAGEAVPPGPETLPPPGLPDVSAALAAGPASEAALLPPPADRPGSPDLEA